MARIRPLTPREAVNTFTNRIGRVADSSRQLATNLGLRSYRCFLTWTRWTGEERGEGREELFARVEILPTPRVLSIDSTSFSLFHGGTMPEGSLRVERISVCRFTEDILLGKALPHEDLPFGESAKEKHVPQPFEFFWEVVEDGRGDCPAKRARFRPMNRPFRRAGSVDWTIVLERTSMDRTRDDESAIGTGLE